jgi:hypothetical protein
MYTLNFSVAAFNKRTVAKGKMDIQTWSVATNPARLSARSISSSSTEEEAKARSSDSASYNYNDITKK